MSLIKELFRPGQIVCHRVFGHLQVIRVFGGVAIGVQWVEQDPDAGEYYADGDEMIVSDWDLTLLDYNLKVGQLISHDFFSGLFRIVEIVIPNNMLKVEGVYKSQKTGEYVSNGSSWFLFARDCEKVEDP